MGFLQVFNRSAASNAASTIVLPVTPQKTVVASKASPGSQRSTTKRLRAKIEEKLTAFSLRRRNGVTTVTVSAEHYMPSLQDSGYASGFAERDYSTPPMTPVAANDASNTDAIHKSMATTVGEPITEEDITKDEQTADERMFVELQETPCPKPTLPSKAKDLVHSKTFQSIPDRHSAPTPHPKKATHARNISASIPISKPLQIRSVIQDLAYHGVLYHSSKALATIGAIENIQKLSRRTNTYIYDPFFEHNGFQFTASQLDAASHVWLARVILAQHLDYLTQRRLLHPDDYEVLKYTLFPTEKYHIRDPDILYILLDGLVHDDLITEPFATKMRDLALTLPEFTGGPSAMSMGQPQSNPRRPFHRTFSALPTTADSSRARALRHLVEAAVYPHPTPVWKGVWYADARAQLASYHAAYECTYERGVGTPPRLTPFKRALSFGEQRDLVRGKALLELQARFDAGALADFGLLKHVRGAYFPVPCQPGMEPEELGQFLYARVVGSGVRAAEVPRWVALHPAFDREFARGEGVGAEVKRKLGEELKEFERVEEERMRVEDGARRCWREKTKAERGRLGRLGMKVKALVRKKAPERPFDPFAE